ncbi:uncharacterized protein PFL1_05574 [Pseudozyma flocculosa PF-1]|nr:uncharacterized protein PFL1_05574 [Pseudozyma flocculosa PF-1]EPQ26940.1 hypothetical protein PFL1_05574 [Pseudozyma flocculosa PF-1]
MSFLNPGAVFRDAIQPVLWASAWCCLLVHLRAVDFASIPSDLRNGDSDAKQQWDRYEWLALRVLGSLGTVTGMLLAFRSNSAMDRWNTGRRKWAEMQATSRSLVRLLAAALIPMDAEEPMTALPNGEKKDAAPTYDDAARRSVDELLALIPFFGIALMYQLRGEPIQQWRRRFRTSPDILDRLPARLLESFEELRSPRNFGTPGQPRRGGVATKSGERKREIDMLNNDPPASLRHRSRPARDGEGRILSNHCALSTLVHLQGKLDRFHGEAGQAQSSKSTAGDATARAPKLSGPVYAHSIGLLNSISSQMAELERVRDTPIPLSLSLHFSRLLFVNTLLLPVVLVNHLSDDFVLAVLATALVTAMLYGIDSVSATLSQPFGTDKEDLPLERWCMDFEREWLEMQQSVCDADVERGPSGTARDGGVEASVSSSVQAAEHAQAQTDDDDDDDKVEPADAASC